MHANPSWVPDVLSAIRKLTSGLPVNRKEFTPASVNREVLWTPKTDTS